MPTPIRCHRLRRVFVAKGHLIAGFHSAHHRLGFHPLRLSINDHFCRVKHSRSQALPGNEIGCYLL